jgi:hypothetical protein
MTAVIPGDIKGQVMHINSYTINNHPKEQEIVNTTEYMATFQFLEDEMQRVCNVDS